MTPTRSFGILFALLSLLFVLPASAGSTQPQDGRVVVLGFDGADARTTERMMDDGDLPNLAKLREGGTFSHLQSTNPAESAAGWAALNTGTNPLKNNVPSFINRPASGAIMPDQAHIKVADVKVEDLGIAPGGITQMFDDYPLWQIGTGIGVAVFLIFFVLFKLALRAGAFVSVGLSALLGGAGAFAATQSSDEGGDFPPVVPKVTINNVTQDGFWDHAARGGKKAIVLDAALAFGRPETPGARVLAGLGLPDARGAGNGNWFYYSTNEFWFGALPSGEEAGGGSGTGFRFRVTERDNKATTKLVGPMDFTLKTAERVELADVSEQLLTPGLGWKESEALRERKKELEGIIEEHEAKGDANRATVDMEWERKGDTLAITIAGETQEAKAGEWTDWFHLPFELSNGWKAGGITRARIITIEGVDDEDYTTVYFHTFDIDPTNPSKWQPVSSPPEFSAELAEWNGGPFETLGWSCMTNQIKDKKVPIDIFLEDIEFTMKWREQLTDKVLGRDDWDLLFSVFSTTDRVQHMMYRYHDPLHPGHDPEEAEREVTFFGEKTKLRDVIPAIYKQMDRIVGKVVAQLEPADQLFLCADHGFTSYRRGFEINNWLAQEGYMTVTPTKKGKQPVSAVVDWSQTQAYGLGLGMVYVNMAGRESGGIVPKSEAKALLKEIGDKMVEFTDAGPDDAPFEEPKSVVRDYAIVPDLYQGGEHEWGTLEYVGADMMVGVDEFYRISWGAVGGTIRFAEDDFGDAVVAPAVRNNTNNWSGDHASNSPLLVTGIFFSRKPVDVPEGGVHVMHIAPTVLNDLGIEVPEVMDLTPLKHQ